MKKIIALLLLLLFLVINGCGKKEAITQQEWLSMIAETFYGVNESSEIEKLLQYGVINDCYEINDTKLNQAYAAKTLMIAASLLYHEEPDINKKNDLDVCLELGIFDELKKQDELIYFEEADIWIKRAEELWKNPKFENAVDIHLKEEVDIINETIYDQRIKLNEEMNHEVLFIQNEEEPYGAFYRIISIEDDEAVLKGINAEDVIESVQFSFQEELDFSNAIVLDLIESEWNEFDFMSNVTLTSKTFELDGFKVTWRLLNNGIKATVEKKEEDALITDSMSISNIVPSIRWKSTWNQIEYAYLKLNYTASNSFKINKKLLSGTYFDTKEIVSKNWQVDLNSLAEKTAVTVEKVIPIAKILVPLPSIPYLNIELIVQIGISAEGEVNLSVSSSGLIGFEIINNKIRFLDEVIKNASADINAKLALTMGIKSCLNIANQPLADLSFNIGVGATMSMIGHLKNTEGEICDAIIGIGSLNILNDLIHSDPNQEILICGDLSAHWIAKINVNSSSTLANRLGLFLNVDLLNEKNAPLFDKSKLHVENFKFVDHCTWINAKKRTSNLYLDIASYQYVLNINESKRVEITNLPQDVKRADLVFSSLDESIAKIDQNGIIVGISEGSTRILVSTKDRKYQISAAVLVEKI